MFALDQVTMDNHKEKSLIIDKQFIGDLFATKTIILHFTPLISFEF